MAKKKTLLIVSIIFIMTIIISALTPLCAYADGIADSDYQPRLTAPSSSSPYYSRELNTYFKNGYGMPNCVAYAFGRIYEMNGEKPLITRGSAGDWYFINKRNNYYEYGSTPKLGAIACWSNHVAVVEKINDNGSVTLSESHWHGRYFNTVTYSNMYSHFGQRFYGYIYAYNEGLTQEIKDAIFGEKELNTQYKQEAVANPVVNRFDLIKLDNNIQINEQELALERILNN